MAITGVSALSSNSGLRVCFVAHFAYRALSGASGGHIGGVERQTALMAKWLAARGHEVSVVVWNEGQDEVTEWDGVRVISVCRQDQGLPGLRFFTPRWVSLRRALAMADADIYYHNCAEYVTGQVAMWAKSHDRQFVYSVASEPECDPKLPILTSFRERILYRHGLRLADAIVVQTNRQKEMLRTGFSLAAEVLPMPCETLTATSEVEQQVTRNPGKVLWIGRLAREKRIHLLVEVAKECPQFEFDVVGPDGTDQEYSALIHKQCADLENVNMIGSVDFADVLPYYRSASVLCCTSSFEGFPNTFLEGWSQGLPTVSTVDPDDVISKQGLGAMVADPSKMAKALCEVLENPAVHDAMSKCAIAYFLQNHEKNAAMSRFEKLLQGLPA